MFPRVVLIACCAFPGCRGSVPAGSASQWPEADALFHSNPQWLGSDGAYSVALLPGKTLWLFGDTFVATSPQNVRSESKMVRNTVAIQTGTDPALATAAFAWGDGPASFFPDGADQWLWPLHGIRVANTLVLFFSNVKRTPGQGLGFANEGWRAAIIDNPDSAPRDWHVQMYAGELQGPGGRHLALLPPLRPGHPRALTAGPGDQSGGHRHLMPT